MNEISPRYLYRNLLLSYFLVNGRGRHLGMIRRTQPNRRFKSRSFNRRAVFYIECWTYAHCQIARQDIRHELWQMPHKEKSQPKGYKAVYIYSMNNGFVLKVGRVSENSGVRYQNDHYTIDIKGSTLSTSILKRTDTWPILGIDKVDDNHIADWIRCNTDRDNLLISASHSDFLVYLLEAFLHCRLNPLFEGRKNDKGRKQFDKTV